jgi:hypothetical protein
METDDLWWFQGDYLRNMVIWCWCPWDLTMNNGDSVVIGWGNNDDMMIFKQHTRRGVNGMIQPRENIRSHWISPNLDTKPNNNNDLGGWSWGGRKPKMVNRYVLKLSMKSTGKNVWWLVRHQHVHLKITSSSTPQNSQEMTYDATRFLQVYFWLVVWICLDHFLCSPIVGMMIQSDYIIFFRGVETTNQIYIYIYVQFIHANTLKVSINN